jgi:hypothetical protein
MRVQGLTEQEISALCDMWNLGNPIDVLAFLDRNDIPEDVRHRVLNEAGFEDMSLTHQARAQRYRDAQAQIVIELAKLTFAQ